MRRDVRGIVHGRRESGALLGSKNFAALGEDMSALEILDMPSGGPVNASLNADDALEFNGSTGENFYAHVIDLVLRGYRGSSPDTLQLISQDGGQEYAQVGSTTLTNPAHGGPGVTYHVYSDGNGTVIAAEDGVIVATN